MAWPSFSSSLFADDYAEDKPICPYGTKCYRTHNSDHMNKYLHVGDGITVKDEEDEDDTKHTTTKGPRRSRRASSIAASSHHPTARQRESTSKKGKGTGSRKGRVKKEEEVEEEEEEKDDKKTTTTKTSARKRGVKKEEDEDDTKQKGTTHGRGRGHAKKEEEEEEEEEEEKKDVKPSTKKRGRSAKKEKEDDDDEEEEKGATKSPAKKKSKTSTSTSSSSSSSSGRIVINRAPVLALWATLVAMHVNDITFEEAATMGRAITGMFAQAKGKSLGLFESKPRKSSTERDRILGKHRMMNVLGRHLPVRDTEDGTFALSKGKPISSASAVAYIKKAFGDNLSRVRRVMEALIAAYPDKEELDRVAYDDYIQFRPASGAWGAKGTLHLDTIEEMTRSLTRS